MTICIHGVDYVTERTYTSFVLDIFQMYYSGLCIKTISKKLKCRNSNVALDCLIDPDNKELKRLYEDANRIAFEKHHKENGIPKLGGDNNGFGF